MSEVTATAKKIIANVEKVIVGKRRQIILSLVSWFSEGHILLASVTDEVAITLGNLRRRGFAATAIVNHYDPGEFAQASGKLLAEGIPTLFLKDTDQIVTICQTCVLRS